MAEQLPLTATVPTGGDADGANWLDRGTRYGWVSILIHWLTVLVIFTLLFIGDSIAVLGEPMIRLHVSIALFAYVGMAARVVWRWRVGHPTPGPGIGPWSSRASKFLHYIMLAAIGVMLVSGPATACAGDIPLRLFGGLVFPCPTLPGRWFPALHGIHALGARVIVYGVLLHVAAVMKHAIWNRDGTFGRMMSPRPGRSVKQALAEDAAAFPGRTDLSNCRTVKFEASFPDLAE